MHQATSRASRGFTLLEVLIAFVIASLALAALYQAVSAGVGAVRAATLYNDAMSRARSHLDAAVHGGTLTPGDWHGDDGGGFHWHLRVEPSAQAVPYSVDRTSGAANPALVLDTVTVRISWGSGRGVRQVRLDTRQIAMATAPQ